MNEVNGIENTPVEGVADCLAKIQATLRKLAELAYKTGKPVPDFEVTFYPVVGSAEGAADTLAQGQLDLAMVIVAELYVYYGRIHWDDRPLRRLKRFQAELAEFRQLVEELGRCIAAAGLTVPQIPPFGA
jgi:hypothetical protein